MHSALTSLGYANILYIIPSNRRHTTRLNLRPLTLTVALFSLVYYLNPER